MKRDEFRVVVGSDPEHDDLAADITIGDAYVCTVSQEDGYENLCVELPVVPLEGHSPEMRRISLRVLELAIERAKGELWRLRKTSSS